MFLVNVVVITILMISLFIDQDPAPPVGFNLTYICCNNNTNDIIIDQDPAPPVGFNLTYICCNNNTNDIIIYRSRSCTSCWV